MDYAAKWDFFPLLIFSQKEKCKNIPGKKKKILPRKSFLFLSFFFGIKIISFFFLFVEYFDQQLVALHTVHLSKSFFGHFHIISHVFLSKRKKKHTKSIANKLFTYFLLFDGERQKRFTTPKVIHLIPSSKETENPHPQQHQMRVCQVPYFL